MTPGVVGVAGERGASSGKSRLQLYALITIHCRISRRAALSETLTPPGTRTTVRALSYSFVMSRTHSCRELGSHPAQRAPPVMHGMQAPALSRDASESRRSADRHSQPSLPVTQSTHLACCHVTTQSGRRTVEQRHVTLFRRPGLFLLSRRPHADSRIIVHAARGCLYRASCQTLRCGDGWLAVEKSCGGGRPPAAARGRRLLPARDVCAMPARRLAPTTHARLQSTRTWCRLRRSGSPPRVRCPRASRGGTGRWRGACRGPCSVRSRGR